MPTYQYACTECNHDFEQVQSFSDASLTTCPECEGKLRKVFNAVGVVFKGSGFYRNDSRQSSTTSDAPAAKDSGSKESGSKDSGSKDSASKASGSGDTSGSSSSSGSSGSKDSSGSGASKSSAGSTSSKATTSS